MHNKEFVLAVWTAWCIQVYVTETPVPSPRFSDSCPTNLDVTLSWVYLNGMYYGFHLKAVNLQDARCTCGLQDGQHTSLAVLHDPNDFDAVTTFFTSHFPGDSFWLNAERVGGSFVWDNGCELKMDSLLWALDHPLVGMTAVYYGSYLGGEAVLYSESLHALHSPLCQSDSPPVGFLDTFDIRWRERNGKRFGYSTTRFSRNSAVTTCQLQAGNCQLASLHEDLDWRAVRKVFQPDSSHNGSRKYWVDAVKDQERGVFMWGTSGVPVTHTKWLNQPDDEDYLATIERKDNATGLQGSSEPNNLNFFICMGNLVPDSPPLLWTSFPLSSGYQWGLSVTKVADRQGASEHCNNQDGNVMLADFNTYFEQMRQFLLDNYRGRTFWVDIVYQDSDDTFYWGNSQVPVDNMLFRNDPSTVPSKNKAAFLDSHFEYFLHAIDTNTTSTGRYFICMGKPESAPDIKSLSSTCPATSNVVTPYASPPRGQGTTEASGMNPTSEMYTLEALFESSTIEPLTESSDTEPSTGNSNIRSSTESSNTEPPTESSDTEPSTGYSNIRPSTESSNTEPPTGSSDTEPSTGNSNIRSSTESSNTETPTESSDTEPSTGNSNIRSSTESSNTEPSTETSNAESSNTEPGTESAAFDSLSTERRGVLHSGSSLSTPAPSSASSTAPPTAPPLSSGASFRPATRGNKGGTSDSSSDPSTTSVTSSIPPASPSPRAVKSCKCQFHHHVKYTPTEVDSEVQKTRQNLSVDKEKLAAKKRRKSSARDPRPSAEATGLIGVLVLGAVGLVIVVPDLIMMLKKIF